MASYGVAEAKNRFTHLLDQVEEGQRVIITRHGKPVAELRPLPVLSSQDRKAKLLEISARAAQRPPIGITALELINLDRDGVE